MSQKLCPDCGAIVPPVVNGRPRKYCPDCSPSKRSQRQKPTVKPRPVVAEPVEIAGQVYARTLETLQGVGRDATPLGAAVLVLAEQIDAGNHTATGLAALVKQHAASLASALDGVKVERTDVDELRERRERRRGA